MRNLQEYAQRISENPRGEIASWIEGRLLHEAEIDLPGLTEEAVEHFLPLFMDGAKHLDYFPYLLRPFVYQIGLQMISKNRPEAADLELILGTGDDSIGPFGPSSPSELATRWLEHANGHYVAFTEMGTDELLAAADEREKRIATEQQIIQKLRNTASTLKPGEKVKTRIERQLAPGPMEDRERREAKRSLEETLQGDYMEEYNGLCWYCGTILHNDVRHYQFRECPTCKAGWERAYIYHCPQDGEGQFVHLAKPHSVRVSDALDIVMRATGACQCDACFEPFLYVWSWRTLLDEDDYVTTPGSGIPYVELFSASGVGVEGQARELIMCSS